MANRSSFRRSELADEVAAPAPVANDSDQVAAEKLLQRFDAAAKPTEKTGAARKPRNLRRILMVLGPAVVLAGSLFAYMAGGHYVSTDNAYVHAGKLTVATDVSAVGVNASASLKNKSCWCVPRASLLAAKS